ncbi:putative ATPase [Feldmannia species virus]|uniref:Putative ATPase n=1 Tax=Feldmannia species virus TaxID=39420 RepID=B5LWJ4_9PHYC|nr:putative ATPase [Feldmannia species virus]ACH46857.1 putative ATPase [Feldmannia species virus]
MVRVDWSCVDLSVDRRPRCVGSDLWVNSLAAPAASRDIVGNRSCVADIENWFRSNSRTPLLVTGAPGVWKSSAVRLVAREQSWDIVVAYADIARNNKCLDAMVRETSMHRRAVLVLDEFEVFLGEPTALRWIRNAIKTRVCPLVMVAGRFCDRLERIAAVSFHVQFDAYTSHQTKLALSRLSPKLADRHGCFLGQMDCFLIGANSSGNFVQTINQLQLCRRSPASCVSERPVSESHFDLESTSRYLEAFDCFGDLGDMAAAAEELSVADRAASDLDVDFLSVGDTGRLYRNYACVSKLQRLRLGRVPKKKKRTRFRLKLGRGKRLRGDEHPSDVLARGVREALNFEHCRVIADGV